MFRSGFATVIGQGSDAHLAVGSAQFLQHSYPTAVNDELPIDQMPLVWRSKQPIYYALGSVATVSGLEPYETIAAVAALLLALAAVGLYLVSRELLGTGVGIAATGMAIAGLDRMVIHTGMHPYFNQTWGYMTMPFALVLGWWAVRQRSRGALALLALFLAIGAFAYPLALPIPVLGVAVAFLLDRRARRAAGEQVPRLRTHTRETLGRLYAGKRSLLWIVPVGVLLAVPVFGVAEKLISGVNVALNPSRDLTTWAGDLNAYFPEHQFLALNPSELWWLAAIVLAGFAWLALRDIPRPLALGITAVLAGSAAFAASMRLRDFGFYFHFKMLAFAAPLFLTCAVAGIGRLRRFAPLLLVPFVLSALHGARAETRTTFDQLPRTILDLRAWERALPQDASIRLDMNPQQQIWVGYMLSPQPLCSQRPLLGTSYPHVPVSRRADYAIVDLRMLAPFDSIGEPLMRNKQFRLYRLGADVPGKDLCSRRMVQTVTSIAVS